MHRKQIYLVITSLLSMQQLLLCSNQQSKNEFIIRQGLKRLQKFSENNNELKYPVFSNDKSSYAYYHMDNMSDHTISREDSSTFWTIFAEKIIAESEKPTKDSKIEKPLESAQLLLRMIQQSHKEIVLPILINQITLQRLHNTAQPQPLYSAHQAPYDDLQRKSN